MKMKLKKYIFIASIIVASFFLLLVIGKKFESPFKTSINAIEATYYFESDENEKIIVCGHGKQISFLNKKNEIISNIFFDDEDPITNILGVMKYNNDYYLYGSKKEKNSIIISNDRVVRYSNDFTNYDIVFDLPRGIKSWNEKITDVIIEDDNLYVSEIDFLPENENVKSFVYSVDLYTKEKKIVYENDDYIYCLKYFPKNKKVYLLKYFDNFEIDGENNYQYTNFLKKNYISRFALIDENNIVWHALVDKKVYLNDKELLSDIYIIAESISGNKIMCLSQEENKLIFYDVLNNNISEFEKFDYSISYIIFIWLKCISVVYVILLIIILIVKSIYKLYKEQNQEVLKNIFAMTVLTIIVFSISAFYLKYSYDENFKNVKSNINSVGNFITRSIDDGIIDINNIIPQNDDKSEYEKSFNILNKSFGMWVKDEAANENYLSIAVCKIKDDKLICIYDSTYSAAIGTAISFGENVKDAIINNGVLEIDMIVGDYIDRFLPIYDLNDNLIGTIMVGYDYELLLKQTLTSCVEISISILIVLTIIYVFFKELIAFFNGLRKKFNDQDKNYSMLHTFSFFHYLSGDSLDGVIIVIISREMLKAGGVSSENIVPLLAMPMFFAGMGYFLSYFVYILFSKKFTIRKALVSFSSIMVILAVFISFAVLKNSFVIFCILKFCFALIKPVIIYFINCITMGIKDDKKRFEISKDMNLGRVSSNVVGILLGGFISQNFGNIALYVFEIGLAIIRLVLFYLFAPKEWDFIDSDDKNDVVSIKEKIKIATKFVVNPFTIGILLFFAFPIEVVGGYKSFIFPLFTSELNWSKMYISNFIVLSNVLILVIIGPILNYIKKQKPKNVAIYSLILIGIIFIGFYINVSPMWVLTVLFIVDIFKQIATTGRSMLWFEAAKDYNINKLKLVGTMSLIENFFCSIKDVFMASLIMMAGNKAGVFIGIFCIICSGVLLAFTKKSIMLNANKIKN